MPYVRVITTYQENHLSADVNSTSIALMNTQWLRWEPNLVFKLIINFLCFFLAWILYLYAGYWELRIQWMPEDEYMAKWWQRMLHQQVIKIQPEEIVPKISDEETKWVLNPCHSIDNDHWLTDKNTSAIMNRTSAIGTPGS